MATIFGKRLFFGVLALFLLFAGTFILWQLRRERDYKRELVRASLLEVNQRVVDLHREGLTWNDIRAHVATNEISSLRLTVIDTLGVVLYDSEAPSIDNLPNHAGRQEVRQALAEGEGCDYDRESVEDGRRYFYVATYAGGVVLRTALPYDDELRAQLKTDNLYLWVALVTLIVLVVLLWSYIGRSTRNIVRLRQFARRATRGEHIAPDDANGFPNDELGYVARRIVALYQQLQETTAQQMKLKKEMTDNIAHELKTPLTSLNAYLQTLTECDDLDEPTRQQFLQRSVHQAARLTALVADITTLNKLDLEDCPLHREEVDLRALILAIADESRPQLEQRHMRMLLNLPNELNLYADRGLLYSVFRNLTDNALAYAGEGATVCVDAHDNGPLWQFTFADDGIGVEEQHLTRLFERFYTTDRSRSRQLGGTGLGLAIVKNAILKHGGSITVVNRVGGGLQFDFTLPKNSPIERRS